MVAANAVLLAAAPELAEALREIVDCFVQPNQSCNSRYGIASRHAIELLKRVGY